MKACLPLFLTAVVCLMAATAVTGATREPELANETQGAAVEALVQDLVARGADETAVRKLVREASRLRRPEASRLRRPEA